MDLNKNISFKDLSKISLGSNKNKPVHISTKRGINLAHHEDEEKKRKQTRIIIIVAVVLLLLLLYFGVINPLIKSSNLSAEYDATHEQYEELSSQLEDYDKIQLEYRTYSMDWMNDDEEGRYVSVDRRKILDMVEKKIMPKGTVEELTITGDTMNVKISGMNLQQVSTMCADIEKSPFVAGTVLQTATTDGDSSGAEFDIEVRLQSETESSDGSSTGKEE